MQNGGSNQKLDLQSMLAKNTDFVDNTSLIRDLKHSNLIAADLSKIENFKRRYAEMRITNPEQFLENCKREANFLYEYYTDIFTRVVKDELHIGLMAKFLHTLQRIENGEMDQTEASVVIGTLLKEMYVDSALRRSEHLDEEHPKPVLNEGKTVSWKEYKNYIM